MGGSNVKNFIKPKTYNPGKRDFVQNIIGYSLTTVVLVYGLLKWPHDMFWLISTSVFVVLDVICVYYMLRDPTCKTFITIDSKGAHIFFSNMEKMIFIPWSSEVYVNVCIEPGYPIYRQLTHRRILCLSNVDIKDEFLLHKQSINWTHEMPTDDYAPWFVFLVVSAKVTCKREAKRVLAFKEAALAKK